MTMKYEVGDWVFAKIYVGNPDKWEVTLLQIEYVRTDDQTYTAKTLGMGRHYDVYEEDIIMKTVRPPDAVVTAWNA